MSQVQQVKDATNIVDVIGSKVGLQRSGSNFRGLCPFHSEKSPSFFVSENMQRYKCFGCGKTGDVFTFLQEYEGMTFREALESLAQAAGITLENAPATQDDEERTKLLEVLDLARSYYHFLLTEHAVGEKARQYLKDRGTTKDSIKLFQLGYALPAWDGLTTYLHDKKKYDYDWLIKAGLATRHQSGRVYDRFRSRIMFPLRNHRGQIVGFSGRILDSSEKDTPKYINTPETMLYHKSQMLFGFYENLQAIRKERKVVLVEGEFDVISSTQAHVSTVVAIKGSALTADHVKLLSRSVDQIILSLDADSAGIAATKKAIEVVKANTTSREQPLILNVLRISDGKDPDEMSKNDPKAWRELVKRPITAYEFLIDAACERNDVNSPEGKLQIMTELVPVLSQIDQAVQYEYYTKVLAEKLGASVTSVQSDVQKYKRHDGPMHVEQAERTQEKQPEKTQAQSKQEELENYLLFIVLNAPPVQRTAWLHELQAMTLVTTGLQPVFTGLQKAEAVQKELGDAVKTLPNDLQQRVFELATNEKYYSLVNTLNFAEEWAKKLKELHTLTAKAEGTAIEAELELLDRVEEKTPEQESLQEELLKRLVELRKKKPK